VGRNMGETLLKFFAPNQLEQRFGGVATDLEAPSDFYPPRFPPGPFTPVAPEAVKSLRASIARGASSDPSPRPDERPELRFKLHAFTSIGLHEGTLWVEEKKDSWVDRAKEAVVTPEASMYARDALRIHLPAVETFDQLLKLLRYQEKVAEVNAQKDKEMNGNGATAVPVAPEKTAEPATLPYAPPESRQDLGYTTVDLTVPQQASAGSSPSKPEAQPETTDIAAPLLTPPSAVAAANTVQALRTSGKALAVEEDKAKKMQCGRPIQPTTMPLPPETTDNGPEVLTVSRNHQMEGPVNSARCPLWCGCSGPRRV